MRVRIEGFHLPGRTFVSDGTVLTNGHVAVQERREPIGPVAGDEATAAWEIEVRVANKEDGATDRSPGRVSMGPCRTTRRTR